MPWRTRSRRRSPDTTGGPVSHSPYEVPGGCSRRGPRSSTVKMDLRHVRPCRPNRSTRSRHSSPQRSHTRARNFPPAPQYRTTRTGPMCRGGLQDVASVLGCCMLCPPELYCTFYQPNAAVTAIDAGWTRGLQGRSDAVLAAKVHEDSTWSLRRITPLGAYGSQYG